MKNDGFYAFADRDTNLAIGVAVTTGVCRDARDAHALEPLSWFGKRDATVAEDATQSESTESPEEGAGNESDASTEGDSEGETPNDPLS